MERRYDRNKAFPKWDSNISFKKMSRNSLSSFSKLNNNILSSSKIYKKDDTCYDIVERLWKKVNNKRIINKKKKNIFWKNRYTSLRESEQEEFMKEEIRDTTIDFLNYNTNNIKDNNMFKNGLLSDLKFSNIGLNNSDIDSKIKTNSNDFEGSYFNSKKLLNGLTFNDIYDENISKLLIKISEIFELNKEEIEDLISLQIAYNRSWKLFLIGLFQYESINRFFSMVAIKSSVKYVNNTLLDIETLKGLIFTLNNISVSDESRVNRMKAIYLLGEFSKYFGQTRTNDDLILFAFKKIIEQLLDIQYKEKTLYIEDREKYLKFRKDNNEKKNYLLNALGKFTKYPTINYDYMKKLTLFTINAEIKENIKTMDEIDETLNDPELNLDDERKETLKYIKSLCEFTLKNLLDIINNDLYRTEDNKGTIGRIFENYLPKILESSDSDLAKKGVQFIGNWFSVIKNDNLKYEGLKLIKEGHELATKICLQKIPDFLIKEEKKEYDKQISIEQIKYERLKMILRSLFSIPGTKCTLEGNKEFPGFFENLDSTMLRTESIVMFLPINPDSKVTIIRPLPKIPGVPDNATTVPPVFFDHKLTKKQINDLSLYEKKEKCGLVSDLPLGYTYDPGIFDKEKQKSIDGYNYEDNKIPKNAVSVPTRVEKALIPPGFLSRCPFFGFDFNKLDKSGLKNIIQSSEISFNDEEINQDIPDGTTTENTPVIYPNKNINLKSFGNAVDFPENAPVILEIIKPNETKVRRIKLKVSKVDNEMCVIDDNFKKVEGERMLKNGETINIYIKNRNNIGSEWIPINMEVVDEDYRDDYDNIGKYFKKNSIPKENKIPIPAGLASNGLPYFSPAVNLPPFPVGYTKECVPYYGKKSTIKPIPYGLTNDGLRFYPNAENITALSDITHVVATGYNNNGQPFFLPKSCYLPKPSGFTPEGIPFYDIYSFIHQDGFMVTPLDKSYFTEAKEKDNKRKLELEVEMEKENDDYEELEDLSFKEDEKRATEQDRKREEVDGFFKGLISNNKIIAKQFNTIKKLYNKVNTNYKEQQQQELNLQVEPIEIDILKYIKEFNIEKTMISNKIKFAYEPNLLSFQSINTPVTKTINIKYISDIANDPKEYKYYINVKPSKIFDTSKHLIKIHHDEIYPINITFNPKYLSSDAVDGIFSVINDKGKSYMTCKLKAIKESYINISHESINLGWIFPDKTCEYPLIIENKSTVPISLTICLKHGEYIFNEAKEKVLSFNKNKSKNELSYLKSSNFSSVLKLEEYNDSNPDINSEILGSKDNNNNDNDDNNNGDSDNNNSYISTNNNNNNNNNNNVVIDNNTNEDNESTNNIYDNNNNSFISTNNIIDGNNSSNKNNDNIDNANNNININKIDNEINNVDTEVVISSSNLNMDDKNTESNEDHMISTERTNNVTENSVGYLDEEVINNRNDIVIQDNDSYQQYIRNEENPVSLRSNKPNEYVKNAFSISTQALQLNPLERKVVYINFEPKKIGKYEEQIEIYAPGGEVKLVKVKAKCGIPLGIYPEDSENSKVKNKELENERNEIVNIIINNDFDDIFNLPNKKDEQIIDSLRLAINDSEYRDSLYTIDYGIFINKEVKKRSLTLMNFTDDEMKISLFSTCHILSFDEFIIVPKQSSKVVDININFGYYHNKESFKGIINEKIELLCPGIDNIILNVKGFVGQPLLIPSWELCFFTPCQINSKSSLNMSLINHSQYDLSIIIKFPRDEHEVSYITSSLSSDSNNPSFIKAFSTIPISFSFNARERGLILKQIVIKIIKPFTKEVLCGLTEKGINLIGICLYPYQKKGSTETDYNSLDFISSWLLHPRRILNEFPTKDEMKKMFMKVIDDTLYRQLIRFQRIFLVFHSISEQRSDKTLDSYKKVIISNNYDTPVDINIINSPCFNSSVLSKELEKGEEYAIEYYYNSPIKIQKYSTIYGFSLAIEDTTNSFSSMQLIGKNDYDFLVFPCPDENKELNIDFGNIETSQKKEKGISRTIMLCNLYALEYIWNVSFIGSKDKYCPFSISLMEGELASNETFPLTFTFNSEVSGTFETSLDLYAKDCTGKYSVKNYIARINLKGTTVCSIISGYPEIIDFGKIIVNTEKKMKFKLSNTGNTRLNINLAIDKPFSVSSNKLILDLNEYNEIEVVYNPIIPGCSTKNLIIYANKKQINIPVKGLSGSYELICKKYKNCIDFGLSKQNNIVWIDCYLTNNGTIPLLLKGITSENNNLFRVEYINNVNIIPNTNEDNNKYYTKDYWQIVKDNLITIINNKNSSTIVNQIELVEFNDNYDENKKFLFQRGVSIPVKREIDNNKVSINQIKENVPQLDAFCSYHFRIGLLCHYRNTISSLNFHYYPIISNDEEDEEDSQSFTDSVLCIKAIGKSYRDIHFSSVNINFPYIPAKCFVDDSYFSNKEFKEYIYNNELENDISVYNLVLSNLDIETQNVCLTEISPEFIIENKKWILGPGEKTVIQIRFEPVNEQVNYRGKAIFKHNHGYTTIFLSGTGASANIYCEKVLDFKTTKMKTKSIKNFKIHNRGLLGCKYKIQIHYHNQISPFTFVSDDDPYDIEGYIESGEKKEIPINCYCLNELSSSLLLLKWQRIPNGIWETETIELKVEIGQPKFEIDRKEINFETTYVGIKKNITISILNSGNANCNWIVHNCNSDIIFEPNEGIIEPDEIFEINVSFNPKNYDPLNETVRFETDCGDKYLLVTGIIGVPYLKIEANDINKDFGVVEIEKYSTRTITLNNTGSKPLKFLTSIINHKINGVSFEQNEYDIFYFKQSKGVIKPNSSAQLNVLCFPIEYEARVTAEYIISSNNGEKCFGNLSCIGGKAKIEIISTTNKDFKLKVNEISHKGFNKNKLALALSSHIKLIKNVIEDILKTEADLKVEEEEFMKEQLKNPLKRRQIQLLKKKEKINFKMKKFLTINSNKNKIDTDIKDSNSTNNSSQSEIQIANEQNSDDNELLEVDKINKKISIPENLLDIYIKSGQVPNVYDNSDIMNDYILLHKINYKNKNEIPKTQDVRAFFEYINSNVDIVTRDCISKIKELLNNKWMKNTDILIKNLKLIQKSSFIIKDIINPIKLCDDTKINTYSLGLIKGSTHLQNVSLFKMVNNGNMDFTFSIIDNITNSMRPLDYNPNGQPFSINPNNDIVETGSFKDITISFGASVTGRYEQHYEIFSDNKPIASFYVNINVGNPIFSVYPDSIDFGITQKNTISTRTLMIINNGTIGDNFILSPKEKKENERSNFLIETTSGQIDCNNEISVPISFFPKTEGKVTEPFLLRWFGKPIIIYLSGTGAEAKLIPQYINQIDITNDCLFFGDAEIGKKYEKEFKIKNVGNVESIFRIEYDEDLMDFEMDNFEKSRVKLNPKQEILIKAIFTPQNFGILSTPIKLTQINQTKFSVPIYANCGEYKYSLNNILPLKGIKVNTKTTRDVELSNTGTFDIPLNIYLYPSFLETIIEIKINKEYSHDVINLKEEYIYLNDEEKIENPILKQRAVSKSKKYTGILQPNGVFSMSLVFKPDICGLMKGALTMSNLILDKPLELPLRFVVYKDEVCLEDISDVNLGRMCINQETLIQQKLLNFGEDRVNYRIYFKNEKLLEESQKDKKKKVPKKVLKAKSEKNTKNSRGKQSLTKASASNPPPIWRITTNETGYISPGSEIDIQGFFTPREETEKDTYKDSLIVEIQTVRMI
ncbi:hypothetical protein BCR36DRAFT_15708 [Piromyces finnis]|uniref:HYDIN/VesB/CFA65-like Ig-like domain-containing protein n=1 Tax=Piromyces finnis TaxID=1754191 RepID=A0A1Y1VF51_9FUNG|nr:hypothetical protein BCR36DRAFT_15708 [Piromyces finnis]|eukprot:ORX54200.1 hypothetical protein BCR36DRAFT_15708 [Piromyces finnis]